MKRFMSLAIEEVLLVICLLWMGWKYSERISPPKLFWIMGISTGIAIALSKLIEVLIDNKLSRMKEKIGYANCIKRWAVCFVLISFTFFLAFNALEYFGDIPATNRLLCILSIVAACDHLMISYVLDVITGQIKGRLMDMVQEKNDEKLCG